MVIYSTAQQRFRSVSNFPLSLRVVIGPALCALCVLIVSNVSAQTLDEPQSQPIVADAALSLYTDYMFRGRLRDAGASLQPLASAALDAEEAGLASLGFWAHLPAGNSELTELDPFLNYDISVAALTFTFGHTWFLYPDGATLEADTAEFSAALSVESILAPRIVYNYDYRKYDAAYVELSLHHPLNYDFGFPLSIVPNLTTGWTIGGDSRYERDGLTHVTYGVFCELSLGDSLLLLPSITYNQRGDEYSTNRWVGGISLSLAF